MKKFLMAVATFLLLASPLVAQIPSGFVQTTATVASLANGQFGAAWTNLSSSPQLGLLGCVSTFQTTVNGSIDANGHFSTLLADTAQICPSPSTWTFTLTFACPVGSPQSAFMLQVPVTGGGGTEDISSQIFAALPANPCNGGGGGSIIYPGPVCNVVGFGARGDCLSGTHTPNQVAVQAAVNACYLNGGAVYFPTNPLCTGGQTFYYLESSVNPKGVSLYGSPGSGGTPFGSPSVVILGAPKKDVFSTLDPTDSGYVTPRETFAVQDLAFRPDSSVDVSTANTTRKPGRTCTDVVTDGTAVITSNTECEFQPGDVGQAISVACSGCGGPVVTTIASWQSAKKVTLTDTVPATSPTVAYISILGLPVTQNVGNCAWASPDATGIGTGPNQALFRNVSITAVGATNYTHSTCGFFFQGNAGPSFSRFQDVALGSMTFAFNFVPVAGVPSGSIYTGVKDYNVFDHIYVAAKYPWLMYSGELQQISHTQMFGDYGPQFVDAYGRVPHTNNNEIQIPEVEGPATGCVSGLSWRVAGERNHFSDFAAGGTCDGSIVQWDASDSGVDRLSIGSHTTAWNLTGTDNQFNLPNGADLFPNVTTNITGSNNTFTTGTLYNPAQAGKQPGRVMYAYPGSSGLATAPYGFAALSRGRKGLARTADFINKGGSHYYFNDDEIGQVWPHDFITEGVALTIIDNQSDSPSGSAFTVPGPGSVHADELNNVHMYLGSQVPATKLRLYYMAKAASATNITVAMQAYYSANWHTFSSCSPSAIGTTYAVYSCDGDATGLDSDQFRPAFTNDTAAANIAWFGITPWDSDTITTSLRIGLTGTPITSQSSANSQVVTCPTGGTTGQVCTADGTWVTPATGAFTSGSNTNGWWVKDPTGTITEHGCVNVTAGGTTHVTAAVTFPLAFPSALESLVPGANNSPDGGDSGTAGTSTWFTSTSASGATANYRCVVDIGGAGCAAITNTVPICWMAIGR